MVAADERFVLVRFRSWAGAALMLATPVAILVILRVVSSLDARFFSPQGHLLAVSGIASCALVIALVASFNSRRGSHPGLVLLSIGAAAVGILMLGHGLTTPGVFSQPFNPWVSRFPHIALAVFAACLYLAGRQVDSRMSRWVAHHSAAVIACSIAALASAAALFTAEPTLLAEPQWEENAWDVVSIAVAGLCLFVMVRHWRRWLLGKDVVQLALAFSAAMTVAAVTSLQHGKFQQLSWWDYHAYLLAGFGCAVYAIVIRSRRDRRVSEVLSKAFSDDVFTLISDGYPEALLQLVKAVELKDAYTHGHSRRTAYVATQLGIRMGLPADRLRVIARGAYLHDLGKIGIPDEILNKPSRLTDEERRIIETHPQLGHEMAKTSSSLHEALGVILHHHERFAGGGYPHDLAGTDIPLEARVVAVADVWDALTTDRAYRRAWPAHEALAHICAARNSHFDPHVVDAMVDLAADWGISAGGPGGSPTVAEEAVETCHHTPDSAELVGA